MNRVRGHALYREGAPCDENGNSIADKVGTYELRGGWGRGSCSCGAVSGELPSSYKRRLWHKEHKAKVTGALDPVDAIVDAPAAVTAEPGVLS